MIGVRPTRDHSCRPLRRQRRKNTQRQRLRHSPGVVILPHLNGLVKLFTKSNGPLGIPPSVLPDDQKAKVGARSGVRRHLAGAIALLSAYSGASSSQGFAPDQPINFPHPVHVQTLGMNCLYCHYSANKSPDPGLPAVGTCMGATLIVGPNRPRRRQVAARQSAEIKKLLDSTRIRPASEEADPVGPHSQAARVRALPAHAPRERGRAVPDLSRPGAETWSESTSSRRSTWAGA